MIFTDALFAPDRAVAAERVEHRRASGARRGTLVDVEAEAGDVVDDADGEATLRRVERELVEHAP
jgi:hypothetical protein